MSEHRSIKGRARVLQSFFDHSGDSFAVKGTQCVYIYIYSREKLGWNFGGFWDDW